MWGGWSRRGCLLWPLNADYRRGRNSDAWQIVFSWRLGLPGNTKERCCNSFVH